jgi:hypothetical protein
VIRTKGKKAIGCSNATIASELPHFAQYPKIFQLKIFQLQIAAIWGAA